MSITPATARRLWFLLEPIHAVTYFAPESLAALKAAGYRGFWMGYFAARAAPFGAVGPEVVGPAFYNFAADRVARALPAAWEFAPPAVALQVREGSAVAALRRTGVDADSDDVRRTVDELLAAAALATAGDRPLFAANRGLPVPTDPTARLWHAATLLREHRGDGHVLALRESGIGGRESHVLHAASVGFGRELYAASRDFTDEEWAGCEASLAARGLYAGGRLTAQGTALKQHIEDETDRLAAEAFGAVDEQRAEQMLRALLPAARAVVRAGDLPAQTPMGLDLSALTE